MPIHALLGDIYVGWEWLEPLWEGDKNKERTFPAKHPLLLYEKAALGEISSQDAELQATLLRNRVQEKYVVVLTENAEDFDDDVTVEDYINAVLQQMESGVGGMTAGEVKPVSVDGREGLTAEVQGSVNGYKVVYWVTCLKTDEDFVQITGWTLQSKADEYGEEIQKVQTSFRTVP